MSWKKPFKRLGKRKNSADSSKLHMQERPTSSSVSQQYETNEELPSIMSGLRLCKASDAISHLQAKAETLASIQACSEPNQASVQPERKDRPTYCYLQPVKGSLKTHSPILEEVSSDPRSPVDPQEHCILSPESNLSLSSSSLLAPPAFRQQFSASSLDSGVGSARSSKRTSLEQTNNDMGHNNSNSSLLNRTGRGQPLFHVGSDLKENLSILENDIPPTTTETEEPKKGRNRLSVDEEAFSQLLQAATIVVSSAHLSPGNDGVQHKFLKNSVEHYKRRMSLSDNPYNIAPQPQSERKRKVSAAPILQSIPNSEEHNKPYNRSQPAKMRKVSAAPILQTIPSSGLKLNPNEMQHRKRSASDCIICERRRKVSQNVEASVLVKTPMAKVLQQGRRFSEVLKVYRPGELPFTELVVPKISELKTPTALPGGESRVTLADSDENSIEIQGNHEDESFETLADLDGESIRTLVDENMPKFVRLTNWSCLYSYLISKGLLDPHMREYMIGSDTQQVKGNKFYGEYLPTQGDVGYLKLLECLKEEEEHNGHKELVEIILKTDRDT